MQPEKPISSQTHLATVSMLAPDPDHKAQLGVLADQIWPSRPAVALIGNLISNTVIVGVSLSVSSVLAASSLLFLVVIHKLEYFAHARRNGVARSVARAWEPLVAMLIMEAVLKNELAARKLI